MVTQALSRFPPLSLSRFLPLSPGASSLALSSVRACSWCRHTPESSGCTRTTQQHDDQYTYVRIPNYWIYDYSNMFQKYVCVPIAPHLYDLDANDDEVLGVLEAELDPHRLTPRGPIVRPVPTLHHI